MINGLLKIITANFVTFMSLVPHKVTFEFFYEIFD